MTVHGTQGEITFFYTEDEVVTTTPAGERRETFGRTDLLENLLAARGTGAPLLCALADTGAFTSVLEAIRTAPDPQEIAAAHITWEGDGDDAHPVVHGIADLIERAAKAQATFAELGVPWARSLPPVRTFDLGRARRGGLPGRQPHPGRVLAPPLPPPRPHPGGHRCHGPPAAGPRVAPRRGRGPAGCGRRQLLGRPHLHPRSRRVRLAAGPRQHRPHAAQTARSRTAELAETLSWNGPDGAPVLTEQRTWTWAGVRLLRLAAVTWTLRSPPPATSR